jgi:F-type H+-transporting ATPase subunit epsilon
MPVELVLEIVSPERLLLSEPVDMVVVPASEGDLGVLPGHSPMVVMLRGGTISIYSGNQVTQRLFVASGFAEITPERCTVLADEAVPLAELNRGEAERRVAAAEAAWEAADKMNIAERDAALDKLQSARAMLAAVAG